ncbi:MAG: hypothetical protein HQL84_06700 [Magnetococcales bacterium]|nr:hypothetical protein [Magnetococcales bacterium]MBF0149721.1 hypothetical protein [Magnetococcales bacterium]MBF0174538.1 hypothetical protein [Magnetococcales bacterium]MBF0347624.1 hypothetical protein [Magnetococcales bacterium]MBF0632809.1 hypothetical protein [Magnetococcales bacterium]
MTALDHTWWIFVLTVVLPTLFLAGCSDTPEIEVGPEMTAGDDFLDYGKRTFFPATYWRDKTVRFSQLVVEERDRFRAATQAYHDALSHRRQEIVQAMNEATQKGQDPSRARREVVQRFRDRLDPLRQRSKEHGRAVSRAMELLQKSRDNLKRTLTQ